MNANLTPVKRPAVNALKDPEVRYALALNGALPGMRNGTELLPKYRRKSPVMVAR